MSGWDADDWMIVMVFCAFGFVAIGIVEAIRWAA